MNTQYLQHTTLDSHVYFSKGGKLKNWQGRELNTTNKLNPVVQSSIEPLNPDLQPTHLSFEKRIHLSPLLSLNKTTVYQPYWLTSFCDFISYYHHQYIKVVHRSTAIHVDELAVWSEQFEVFSRQINRILNSFFLYMWRWNVWELIIRYYCRWNSPMLILFYWQSRIEREFNDLEIIWIPAERSDWKLIEYFLTFFLEMWRMNFTLLICLWYSALG